MERAIQDGPVQYAIRSFSELNALYKAAVVVLLVSLLHNTMFRPKKRNLFPVWATIEIALTSYMISRGGFGRYILSTVRRYGGSLFGLTSKHQVLVNFPGVDRLLSQSYHTVNAEPVQYTLFTRVFGATDTSELKRKLENSWKDLLGPIERTYLNDAAATTAIEKSCIHEKAASFITLTNVEHMKRWELSAGIRVLSPDLPNQPGAVEANLQVLARDFGACISIPLLYGTDFLSRYSQLLDDFWKFDNDLFPLLMIGIPLWAPLKIMKEGLAARSRLANEMEALYQRIDQYQRGEAVDFDADMSDISSTALERNKIYEREGWSIRQRGHGDLAILWGQNANSHPVLFWFLTYVYSTTGLLDKLRDEISPYIQMSQTLLDITSMDLPALFHDCPLLKASILETFRMAVEATSIRYIASHISIDDGMYKHELKPGMFVSAPHALIQRDPSIYPEPEKFIPERFLEIDPGSGKLVARYGRLKPWGTGAAMCKGRTFAEKQIVASGAALISLWDISPAGGTWKVPGMVPGTGVKKPVEDVRVIIKRRVFV